MRSDPLRGKTLQWRYEDGPVAGKTFEHTFDRDGTVSWREVGGDEKGGKPPKNGKPKPGAAESETTTAKYEVAPVTDDVCVFSYLAGSGFTLTSVLDFTAGTVVSFASNEKQLVQQHGMFEVAERV